MRSYLFGTQVGQGLDLAPSGGLFLYYPVCLPQMFTSPLKLFGNTYMGTPICTIDVSNPVAVFLNRRDIISIGLKTSLIVGFRAPISALHGSPNDLAMVRSQMRSRPCVPKATTDCLWADPVLLINI